MRAKTGYRMVTKADKEANPIVSEGALVDDGTGNAPWKESRNIGTRWGQYCNYCVPKDFVFPSEKKKVKAVENISVPLTKMHSFKAWAVVDKEDKEAIMPLDGEYPIDNHILIYNSRKCARQARMNSERVVRVMVTEIL